MVRWSCAGASYSLDKVGQGPIALAVGAGGGCLDILTLLYPFSLLSPSLWETARYRLKYRLKGPLNPKQSINQLCSCIIFFFFFGVMHTYLFYFCETLRIQNISVDSVSHEYVLMTVNLLCYNIYFPA